MLVTSLVVDSFVVGGVYYRYRMTHISPLSDEVFLENKERRAIHLCVVTRSVWLEVVAAASPRGTHDH